MGLGIAYVAANVTRLPVVLMDVNEAQNEKGLQFMGKSYNCFIYQILVFTFFSFVYL